MRKTFALLALASALPLAAQSFEAGVLYTWSPGKSANFSDPGGNPYEFKADTWKAAGLRFGYNFVHIGPMEIQGNATVQFNNQQNMQVSFAGSSIPSGTFKEDYKYWAVGAAVNWDFLVRVGVGLEYRSETLGFTDNAAPMFNKSSTYGRPWARATAGFTIPAPIVKPFIGVEVAVPMTSSSVSYSEIAGSNPNIEALNKAVAPKAQYGIYAGIRF
jgi:hypothetical protein